jgi:predicted HTH domain antitoxin
MCSVTLDIPEESLSALRMTPEALGSELRIAAAMKLYEMGRLSSGAAAALAGIPKPVFLTKLADYGIPTFRHTEEELAEDVRNA